MIIRRQGDGLDSKLRSAALTARLARTAELFAAGRARRGAGFAEEVHTVVAEEERVGGSGTTLAPGRFEGAEFRVPVEFGDAFGFFADEPRGDFTHGERYGQDVAGLDANFQGVLADQVIQFGGAVQLGGGHAAALLFGGIRFGGAARARGGLAFCSMAAARRRISGCTARSATGKSCASSSWGIAGCGSSSRSSFTAFTRNSACGTRVRADALRQTVTTPSLDSSLSMVW